MPWMNYLATSTRTAARYSFSFGGDDTADAGDGGVQALRQGDVAGGVSGRDGVRRPVAGAVRTDRAVLPKPGTGRPPVGVERMLRIYFLQQWFNLSDPAVEEALYDSPVMRQFVGIDLGQEPAPDETTAAENKSAASAP